MSIETTSVRKVIPGTYGRVKVIYNEDFNGLTYGLTSANTKGLTTLTAEEMEEISLIFAQLAEIARENEGVV